MKRRNPCYKSAFGRQEIMLVAHLMKPVLRIALAAVLLPTAPSAQADEIRAFHNINQLPFKQIFGLPSLDNSPLTEAGKWRLNFIGNLSNTYDIASGPQESLVTDLETFRGSLVASYGMRDNWQLSVEIPYVNHGGGFLDDLIYDWHDFFGMPQNGRTKDNSDQLEVSYLSAAAFELPGPASGIGDLRINVAHSRPWKNRSLIFSAELKLPSGDFDKLTGSGGTDFSVGLTLNDPFSFEKYRLTLYGGLAAVFLGDMDGAMAAIQNNFVVAGRAGMGWQATKRIQLKLQLDAQSDIYDSDLKPMGASAFQLFMGGSLTFTKNVYLDIAVAEDIKPSTAADVAFQLALVVTH
jgi:hypothetical protein